MFISVYLARIQEKAVINLKPVMKFLLSNFFVWTVSLLVKLLVVRHLIFPGSPVFDTLLLEGSTILILFSLIEMAVKKAKIFFYLLVNIALSTVFLAIILYYSQFGRLITYYALYQVGLVDDIGQSISALFDYRYLLLYADILVALLLMVIRRCPLYNSTGFKRSQIAFAFLLSVVVSLANLYVHNGYAINTTRLAETAGIMNAEGYQVFASAKAHWASAAVNVSLDQIKQVKGITQPRSPKYFGVGKDKNLIIVQLESIQNFPLGLAIDSQEVTPNLNQLAKDSLYFPHFFTQIGQGSTSDAEFAVNTSLYPLENGAVTSLYKNKDLPGLPKLLKSAGYVSYTFHANKAAFWNRDKLYPALGFNKYFDLDFFGSHDLIDMGPSDEYLFQKSFPVLDELRKHNQKFYADFVTLTSHHPFVIPDGRTDLNLPDNLKGTLIGNYLNAANYEDKALGEFFNDLKQDGLWENSVIVIYGDHFGLTPTSLKDNDKKLFASLCGRTYDYLNMFNIPLIIRVPGLSHQEINLTGGQVDILPTLANLFGISLTDKVCFGEDLLNNDRNLIGIRYFLPVGSFLDNNVLFLSDTGETEVITSSQKGLGTKQYAKERERILQLENLSDAYLRSLPEKM